MKKYIYVNEVMEVNTDSEKHDLDFGTFDIIYKGHNVDDCGLEGCDHECDHGEDIHGASVVHDEPHTLISVSDLRCLVEAHKEFSNNDSAYDQRGGSVELSKFDKLVASTFIKDNLKEVRKLDFQHIDEWHVNCREHDIEGVDAYVLIHSEGDRNIAKIVVLGDTQRFLYYLLPKLTDKLKERIKDHKGYDQKGYEGGCSGFTDNEWLADAWMCGFHSETVEYKPDTWDTASLPSFINLSDTERDIVESVLTTAMDSIEQRGVELGGSEVCWDGGLA